MKSARAITLIENHLPLAVWVSLRVAATKVMHMGLAARAGFFPGVSKGLSFSLMLFRLKIT